MVHALVGDRLDAGRHVERAHLVGAGRERGVRLDRFTLRRPAGPRTGTGLAAIRYDGVDHAVEADDLRRACERTVDRSNGLPPQRVEPTVDTAADLEERFVRDRPRSAAGTGGCRR